VGAALIKDRILGSGGRAMAKSESAGKRARRGRIMGELRERLGRLMQVGTLRRLGWFTD